MSVSLVLTASEILGLVALPLYPLAPYISAADVPREPLIFDSKALYAHNEYKYLQQSLVLVSSKLISNHTN